MSILRLDEHLKGIVTRVTYHNPSTGWSVLSVSPFGQPNAMEKVTVHQCKVFAGATMSFVGQWRMHPKYGKQFHAQQAQEHKPASAAALEKYLGSGLIKGVGPKTAKSIVSHFQDQTLDVFENHIERLEEVPGIAQRKLKMISKAWYEHSKIRDVMIFLQQHGISTLFAVRIYKRYGDDAITRVQENPYRLADDFYGIGFFSADKVALSLDFAEDSPVRVKAAIKHVLSASREQGHCYLTEPQIITGVITLIGKNVAQAATAFLQQLVENGSLFIREIPAAATALSNSTSATLCGFYVKSLYEAEARVASRLRAMNNTLSLDNARVKHWVERYCKQHALQLSASQHAAVMGIASHQAAILTGGPGCGKTTTTRVITKLFLAMQKHITLVAPTGRAAQRMSEVIGQTAQTIHRLLKWQGGSFQVNAQSPLQTDVLVVDECSMLDITLADALLQALPSTAQLLMIGDADQLPAVGPGNVLQDIIASGTLPSFKLTEVFRQANSSLIIKYAHQLNQGKLPFIPSPFHQPERWQQGADCLFIDSDEATQKQQRFIKRVKQLLTQTNAEPTQEALADAHYIFQCEHPIVSSRESNLDIPKQFAHVDIAQLQATESNIAAFKTLLRHIHPWSSLHYDLTALDVICRLYLEWIPKYWGPNIEIQVLSPMARGALGTHNLNQVLQAKINPPAPEKPQLQIGQRILRLGDRVIHQRNNYDLNVYNGDIGKIIAMDTQTLTCDVRFEPDGRCVTYQTSDMMDLSLAYAITIHKSQGSEFDAVIIPILTQHFKMLYRNLVYTGLTRAKKFAAFIGTRRALSQATKNNEMNNRQTALQPLLQSQRSTKYNA